MSSFIKAARHQIFLKLAITGPTGSVKTYSALRLATGLANGKKIAVLDSENGSATLYADRFAFDVQNVAPPYTESKFIQGIEAAEAEGYTVLIIDSFSHCWQGTLDYKAGLDARGGNSYTNWHKAGSKFNEVLASLLQSRIHVIACMRSKMDYVLEADSRGKMVPRRVGLAPVMRDGIEYEFSTVLDGDLEHFVTTSKDRTGLFVDQRFQVTEETGKQLLNWLASAPESEPIAAVQSPAPEPGGKGTAQEQLREALGVIHEDWITDFLVNRKVITTGQTILDAPAEYCGKALGRIAAFRKAIVKFGEDHENVTV